MEPDTAVVYSITSMDFQQPVGVCHRAGYLFRYLRSRPFCPDKPYAGWESYFLLLQKKIGAISGHEHWRIGALQNKL